MMKGKSNSVSKLWENFKDGVAREYDEVCGKIRSKGDTWWWNVEVKEAISRKMHTRRCVRIAWRRSNRYNSMKKKQFQKQ